MTRPTLRRSRQGPKEPARPRQRRMTRRLRLSSKRRRRRASHSTHLPAPSFTPPSDGLPCCCLHGVPQAEAARLEAAIAAAEAKAAAGPVLQDDGEVHMEVAVIKKGDGETFAVHGDRVALTQAGQCLERAIPMMRNSHATLTCSAAPPCRYTGTFADGTTFEGTDWSGRKFDSTLDHGPSVKKVSSLRTRAPATEGRPEGGAEEGHVSSHLLPHRRLPSSAQTAGFNCPDGSLRPHKRLACTTILLMLGPSSGTKAAQATPICPRPGQGNSRVCGQSPPNCPPEQRGSNPHFAQPGTI